MSCGRPWPARYIGIPFVEQGFDDRGCHCWGLVWLVYEREIGIALDRFERIAAAQALATVQAIEAAIAGGPWRPVAGPRRDFDAVLMVGHAPDETGRLRRMIRHVGVAYGARDVLHVERGTQTALVRDDHHSIKRRIVGAYRHERLTA